MGDKLLGRRINAARKDRGITSERLSELCNINDTYMRQIESGAKIPSLPVFVTICKELRVSPSYLLADVLEGSGATDLDELTDLLKNATPSQIRMMTAMIKAEPQEMTCGSVCRMVTKWYCKLPRRKHFPALLT